MQAGRLSLCNRFLNTKYKDVSNEIENRVIPICSVFD